MRFLIIRGLDRFEGKWHEQITIAVVKFVHKFHPKHKNISFSFCARFYNVLRFSGGDKLTIEVDNCFQANEAL